MEENILENGIIIICMVEDYIAGKTEENMMDIIVMIKKTVLVFINGLMVNYNYYNIKYYIFKIIMIKN
jgi:hypothetical protein